MNNLHVCLKKVESGVIEEKMDSVEAAEKNSDTVPRIEGQYSVYMYGGKLGMHVSSNVYLPGSTYFYSAYKL